MQLAIAIPQFVADGAFDPAAFRAFLARAEALGFESGWTQEQVLGEMPTLDPLTTMTYAAACSDRLRLGCAVFVAPLHNPLHLAKSLASLDQLSRGRLEIGLGSGGRNRPFAAFGVDPAGLSSRFTEEVRLLRACWTEERVSFDGRFWQLADVAIEPKPLQKPYPPLWFGANTRPALRRAVAFGDGFFGAGSSTTAQFAEQVRILREELARAERDPATFRIAKRVYIAIDDDPARAQQRVAAALDRLYGNFDLAGRLLPVAVTGTAHDCVAGLHAVREAGAERILLNPLFDEREQMERLAAEVVPLLS
jgi:probable F420-dependent oxidoreductase